MKNIYTICFIILTTLVSTTYAQRGLSTFPPEPELTPPAADGTIRCYSTEYELYLKELYPERGNRQQFERWIAPHIEKYKREAQEMGGRAPVLTIPVVVHVIHNGDAVGTGENISDAQVLSQIQVMNEDFRRIAGTPGFNNDPVGADVEIEFCMATLDPSGNATDGIDRINYGTASFNSNGATEAMKSATQWDPTLYLNMWTVRFGGGMSGILGYAQFPDNSGLAGLNNSGGAATTDGVTMAFGAFGSSAIAPGSYSAPYDLGRTTTHEVGHWLGLRHIWGDGGCGVDDFCNDTPASDASNGGCPNHTSCGSQDMVENYMDYTNDACMNIFTQDQKTRMRTVMSVSPRRVELSSSDRCGVAVPTIGFVDGTTTVLTEGTDCSFQTVVLDISISTAATADATVTINTASGTATDGGLDYDVTPSTLIFPAGFTANQQITVRIYNDAIVEGTENLVLDFNVATTGDAVASTADAADHEIQILDDDVAPSAGAAAQLLNVDFNTNTGGFSVTAAAGSDGYLIGNTATSSSGYWSTDGSNTTFFAYTNDDNCNCDKSEDRLISPSFDATGYTSMTLTFDHAFADAIAAETGTAEVSIDGGVTWTPVYTMTNTSTGSNFTPYTTPWVNGVSVNLDAYVGNPDVRVSFLYNDGGAWAYGMAIDNVVVDATSTLGVQTADNTAAPRQNTVPGNATIHFYDPTSGDVMGTINNLSTWDYQCTQMEVDRDNAGAGGATAPFWDAVAANEILAKTFYVDPDNNTPTGTYEITLYYTEAEIAAWEAATGQSRSDLKIIKVQNNPISAVNAGNYGGYNIELIPATLGSFGGDVTLTATFSTGFSGFGAGNPSNPAVLNQHLVEFEGQKVNGESLLSWRTENELDVESYIVDRSTDGITFETLGEVSSQGNLERAYYSFTDEYPNKGVNYYRLTQRSLSGKEIYSKIISIDYGWHEEPTLVFAPNPANKYIEIRLNTKYTDPIDLQIMDVLGRSLVSYQTENVYEGMNNIMLNIDDFAKGVYTVRIQQGPHIITSRFVKE
ncbi:MAG: T9SS type A sorting domain-containing protein [Saprospiraceae bacterium]|nr:T9SS type A sorting domain-containing protein [Saprospiraceae bacterium]